MPVLEINLDKNQFEIRMVITIETMKIIKVLYASHRNIRMVITIETRLLVRKLLKYIRNSPKHSYSDYIKTMQK